MESGRISPIPTRSEAAEIGADSSRSASSEWKQDIGRPRPTELPVAIYLRFRPRCGISSPLATKVV